MASDADELFYGGAAGGGKSDLALGLAINNHRKSIIFRREFPQFYEMILRSKELLSLDAKWNGATHSWMFPDGRVIEFGSVQYEEDKKKYQGRPHDLIVFDEVTQFLKSQYDFLIGWNRSVDLDQRCRIVATGNPPLSPGESWVIDYWAPWLKPNHPKPAKINELRWFCMIDNESVEVDNDKHILHRGEKLYPRSRSFIFASVLDNPFLRDTDYEKNLQNRPEPLRSALLYGKFDAYAGDDPWQVIPTAWLEAAMDRWKVSQPEGAMTALGVDVARGGQDKTVISRRYGNYFLELLRYPGSTTPNGQSVAAQIMTVRENEAMVNVDVIGVGSSVVDILNDNDIPNFEANSAAASRGRDKSGKYGFMNLRAEMWWLFREALDPQSGEDICLPPDSELLADLTAPRYSLTTRGIKIEAKEDIKKRIGRSPDAGEAVIYCAYTSASWGVLV